MSQIKIAFNKLRKYSFHLLTLVFVFLVSLILFFAFKKESPVTKKDPPQTEAKKNTVVIPENEPPTELSDLPVNGDSPPYVAIIIDDLGWNYEVAASLLQIEAPISFAILPNLEYSVKIAREAKAFARDVLLHIPMESHAHFKKYTPLAPLTFSMPDDVLTTKVEEYIDAVPYITGVNNHMGSRFTEHEEGMRTVLNILKRKDLFFVDSLTTPKSIAYRLAKQSGLKTARRNVFLDNDPKPEEIEKRFEELKRIALKTGSAIGIGHPRRNTVLVLRRMVVKLTDAGITIVPVSRLVR